MNRLNKFVVFALVLFIGLGVACAAGVDDAGMDDTTDSSSVSEVMAETSMDSGNLPVEDDVGDNTDPGANPTPYTSISETTYENAVIELSGDQSFVDGVATFSNNVTLISDSVKRTLNNFKIVVSGNNVTINNVIFNHQTSTPTKVIDVTNGASNVLINDTDITVTKTSAVTTMAVNIDNNADNVVVNNSSITVNGAAQTLWHQDENNTWYDELMISGVNIDRASNVNIANSTVKMINTTDTVTDGTTMPAITVKNTANNIIVANNTINSTGATYVYGIMCNDYVSSINISGNKINVTGEIYTAGIDASTSINSYVYENKIIANTTNYHGFGYRQEALAYGIVLATYQTGNSNNNASYNNITLVANVGYGIENYMGSNNKIDYNNITIDAKRGLGIATNASNGNYYRNNKINITCNQDAINVFDEAIPAQNVGIIVINGSSNTISNNHINITETSTTNSTFAVQLDENTDDNTVRFNELYVYNTIGITHYGDNAVNGSRDENTVNSNTPISISIQSFENTKNIKKEIDAIIINKDNYEEYGLVISNGKTLQGKNYKPINVPENSYVILDTTGFNQNVVNVFVDLSGANSKIQFVSEDHYIYRISVDGSNNVSVVDSFLPYCEASDMACKIENSVFFWAKNPTKLTLVNTTIYSLDDHYINFDPSSYNTYFDSTTNTLSSSVSEGDTIVLRNFDARAARQNNYNNPMIINKPVNIVAYDNAKYNADITFVSGSEGSNITGLTLNGNLYINTSNINVRNNTINKGVFVNEGSGVVIEENTFNTDETAIVLAGAIENTIQNNNITTTSTYTITLDADSVENTITGNNLQAAELTGTASVLDNGEDNVISDGGDEPIIVEPELRIDTIEFTVGSPATITASIYKGDEVDSTISKGKVVFKVNGKTLKDSTGKVIYAKVTGGVATITDYEVPSSWAKDNVTIQAVYSGSSQCDALRAEANLTVTKDSPAITTSDVTASKGETVTLTATVAAGNTPVNVGKVVFKVNGKTVKDSNGKVIYASVVNGQVSVNYTVPENMKAGSYNITVTFTAPGYEKLTDTKTLTVSA